MNIKQFCIFVLLISCLLLSCQRSLDYHNIVGTYETEDFSSPRKAYQDFNKIRRVVGLSLVLNEDSTFQFETCTSIYKGLWEAKDSLLLVVDTSEYKPHFLNSRHCTGVAEDKGRILDFGISPNRISRKHPNSNGTTSLWSMTKID